jgi:hypothetical protein
MATTTTTLRVDRASHRALSLLAIGLAVTSAHPALAETKFTPTLAAELTYTDNVNLAPPDAEEGEGLLQVMPGFQFDAESPRFEAHAEYRLDSYFVSSGADNTQTFHQFEADSTWATFNDVFSVAADARVGQAIIDPSQPIPTSHLSESSNLTDAGSWSITPRVQGEVFRNVQGMVGFEYGEVRYFDTLNGQSLDDFANERIEASLQRPAGDRRGLGWSLSYTGQRLKYTGQDTMRHDLAQAELEFRLVPSLGLIVRGGAESDLTRDQTSGSFDQAFWQGGIRWNPSLKHSLALYAGKRFYDDAYEAQYQFSGRILKAGVSYQENPQTQALDWSRGRILSTTPEEFDPQLTPVQTDLYLSKAGRGWLTLTGRRNEITITAFRDQRSYFVSGRSESELSGGISWGYRLGPRTTLLVDATRTEFTLSTAQGREDKLLNLNASLRRQLGRRTTADLTYRHYRRDGDVNDPSLTFLFYRENLITLGLRVAFR